MDAGKIKLAMADITGEADPTLKSIKLASLCSGLWRERGVELVVVGGSAIEILTEGAYASGDLDMCHLTHASLPLRERQELMGLLGAEGGPRNWKVAGMFLDLLGPADSFARTPYRRVRAPYGDVQVMKPEDLLVERVLVSCYPEENLPAKKCAEALAASALRHNLEMDWKEVRRIAELPEYRNLVQCAELVQKVADELKIQSPLHPDSRGN